MSALAQNLSLIEKNIALACAKAGRDRTSVRVLLASKTVNTDRLREAAALGYKLFGENRVQELLEKVPPLQDLELRWDFIGHLQSNKVKDVVDHCTLIHSVDRLSLAQEISKRALQKNKSCRILVEVNTSGEATKSGVTPEGALELCRQISQLEAVKIDGLMTLAVNSQDPVAVRGCFTQLRKLATHIEQAGLPHVSMAELSMGMSQDYTLAVEEGATLLRLGSAAFGARA